MVSMRRAAVSVALISSVTGLLWVLENKNVLDELSSTEPPKNGVPWCVSLTWSADGNLLIAGSTVGNMILRFAVRSLPSSYTFLF